ncbi:hypothetical protein V6N13_094865 [Hibiscus sabdariffa]
MSEVELQLCLALPTPNITKGFKFNLNNYHGFDHLKQMSCFGDKTNRVIKKRDFEHAFGNFSDDRNALPLLLWSGPPNEEDDDHNDRKKTTFAIDDVNEEDQVVEWPPIKSWRNRTCHHHRRCRRHHHKSAAGNGRSIYVKMKNVMGIIMHVILSPTKTKKEIGWLQEIFHGNKTHTRPSDTLAKSNKTLAAYHIAPPHFPIVSSPFPFSSSAVCSASPPPYPCKSRRRWSLVEIKGWRWRRAHYGKRSGPSKTKRA